VRHFDPVHAQVKIIEGKTGPRVTTLGAEGLAFFKTLTKGRKPSDILLPRADGERWAKSQQHRPMKAALKAAKLPASASAYTLRHTYISRAIERGMPLLLIAENVGTSVKMIEDNYAHILAKTRRDLIERTAPRLRAVVTKAA
jgi:integrase